MLKSEMICFSVLDTFQISVRTVWRPESGNEQRSSLRKGRFAMLLHDTSGRLTTSWTWLKLVKPLYQMGLSVILVDLPGMGKSSINNVSTLSTSVWQSHEGHILCKILDELRVSKCHLVACGHSCSALLRMVKHNPHQMEKEHILHNPVLDYNELFKDSIRAPEPGIGPRWRDILRAEQQHALESFLITSEVRIFATFDQADLGRTSETYESFVRAKDNVLLEQNITPLEVTKEDICEAQIGANVPLCFLFIRKQLRLCYAQFLERRLSRPPLFEPATSEFGSSPATPTLATAWPASPAASPLGQSKSSGALMDNKPGSAGFLSHTPLSMQPALRDQARAASSHLASRPQAAAHQGLDGLAVDAGAFGQGLDWSGLTSTTGRIPQKAIFTSNSAKHEAMSRLFRDPQEHRRRLLSSLPARIRSNIMALKPNQQANLEDIEPGSVQEESSMISDAVQNSMSTYNAENQARRGMRSFRF